MRALVTGAAGFVGRHMVAELEARGYDVTSVDIRPCVPHRAEQLVGLFAWLARDYTRYDLVVHAAARSPHRLAIDNDPGMHEHNAQLDLALFEWAALTLPRRVVYLSSCAVLDEEPDAYGRGKLQGERFADGARLRGIPVTVVRPFSGYGEDQAEDFPFGAFAARARRRADPFEVWGDGGQVRDWIHIDDVVRGALAVADAGIDGPVSLCTGVGTSMDDLARLMCAAAGYEPQLLHRGDRPAGQPQRVGDPTQLLQVYRPEVTLDEGVKRALAGGGAEG